MSAIYEAYPVKAVANRFDNSLYIIIPVDVRRKLGIHKKMLLRLTVEIMKNEAEEIDKQKFQEIIFASIKPSHDKHDGEGSPPCPLCFRDFMKQHNTLPFDYIALLGYRLKHSDPEVDTTSPPKSE